MAIANITGNILTDSGVSTSSLVTGAGTTNYLPKFTGTSTLGNSLIFDNGTNVGIGNTNTTYTFDVTGTGRFTGNVNIDGERLTIGGTSNNAIINNIASVRVNIDCDNTGTGESFTIGHNQVGIDNNNVLFRVQDNANTGIGTSDIVSTNLTGALTIRKSYNGDTPNGATTQAYYANQSALYLFGRNSGLTIISNNTEEGSIIFGNNSTNAYASIKTGSGSSATGGDMYFQVGSNTERMRITSGGYLKASNNGTYYSAGGSYHEILQSASSNSCLRVFATSTSYDDAVQQINCYRTNSSAYAMASFYSNNFADMEFNFRGDGNGYADGSWNGGGADYAEYFEWLDGNPNNEDRRGYCVSLVGNKIKIAEKGETIIGVISGNPSVIGDSAWNIWTEKYLRDDFGTYVRDENGDRVLNPNYNPDIEYIPREQRPEWGIVGLMGKLCIRKGQEVMPNWIKMKDISESVEQWLIK